MLLSSLFSFNFNLCDETETSQPATSLPLHCTCTLYHFQMMSTSFECLETGEVLSLIFFVFNSTIYLYLNPFILGVF